MESVTKRWSQHKTRESIPRGGLLILIYLRRWSPPQRGRKRYRSGRLVSVNRDTEQQLPECLDSAGRWSKGLSNLFEFKGLKMERSKPHT